MNKYQVIKAHYGIIFIGFSINIQSTCRPSKAHMPSRVNTQPIPLASNPSRRSKERPIIRQDLCNRRTIRIKVIEWHSIAPPVGECCTTQAQCQGDDDNAQSCANVEGTRKDIGIATPPAKELPANEKVEDKADNDPLSQVPGSCWRDQACGTKNCREEDIAENTARVSLSEEVLGTRQSKSNEPEPVGPGVEGARCCVESFSQLASSYKALGMSSQKHQVLRITYKTFSWVRRHPR